MHIERKSPLTEQLTDLYASLAALFLAGCSSAAPASALDCKVNVNYIQDLIKFVNLLKDYHIKSVNFFQDETEWTCCRILISLC